MLNRVIQIGLATFLATAVAGQNVAFAQDEPAADPGTETPAPDADGDGAPDSTDAAPADGSADGMATDPSQDAGMPGKKMRVGAAAHLGFNLGNLGDFAQLDLGGLVTFEYMLKPLISLSARAGYLHFLPEGDGVSFHIIPIWLGGKYALGTEPSHLFIRGELAINMMSTTVEIGGVEASSSETKFGINAGAGYDMGALSLDAYLTIYDLGELGDTMGINAAVSYWFASF